MSPFEDPEESILDKISRIVAWAKRVAAIAKTVGEKAELVQLAGEKWNTRKAAGLCPLCGEPPAAGVMFCERDLGKIAAYGLKHADVAAVKDFFGKR